MNTKLTLSLDSDLIIRAKIEAQHRGSSLSRMVGDYFRNMVKREALARDLPPLTKSLLGSLQGEKRLDRDAYRRHLAGKYH